MLGQSKVAATVAVRDLNAVRAFYEDTLGLQVDETEGDEAVTYRAGDSALFVYESAFAGGNRATVATWSVDDVDAEARALAAKGVRFEHYDMPGMTREGDVHVGHGMRVAWFKDPAGNIHNLVGR